MLILEGPNGSGKSTFAKRIREAWQMKVHYVREYGSPSQVWMSSLVQLCIGEAWVLDRCWLTEAIYHRPLRLRLDQLYYVGLLTQLASRFAVLLPPWKVCEERRPGMDKRIWDGYLDLKKGELSSTTLDGVSFLVSDFLPSEVLFLEQPVLALLENRPFEKHRAQYVLDGFKGVGSMHPRVLFLGDRVNLKKDSQPLMPISKTSCGAYLMRMLWHAGLKPREVHVHNAFKPNGGHYRKNLITLLSPDIVIALGEHAHEAAHRYYDLGNAKLGRFHHPQYLRRFESDEEQENGGRLRDLIAKLS